MILDPRAAAALAALLTIGGLAAQESLPPALHEMAETEREFSRAAREKGIRDSFLEFFAADAIAFAPAPVSARERLLKQPSEPFSVHELVWEPRTGDVAASGELGWLTGPSTFIDRRSTDQTPHFGNYLSVWRKQPDGRWRVFIDVGTSVPEEAAFPPGFTRMPLASRYSGGDDKAAATRSLSEADRQLDAAIAAHGASQAYAERLSSLSRLHRPGMNPNVGVSSIRAWLGQHASGMTATASFAEASRAGDLGYTYGTCARAGAGVDDGVYVRIWTRNGEGRWLVAADVVQRVGPRPAP